MMQQAQNGAQILRGFDDEARGHITAAMTARGIDLRLDTDVTRLDRSGGTITVTTTTGTLETDLVLYATGRLPNVAGLGLET